jgi:hypothetical protein
MEQKDKWLVDERGLCFENALRCLPRHNLIIKPQGDQHVEEHIKGDLRRADSGLDLRHPGLALPR